MEKDHMLWSFTEIAARQKPEAIREAVEQHGFPVHLFGLLGWLTQIAEDVPYDHRPGDYRQVMDVIQDLFDQRDPVNIVVREQRTIFDAEVQEGHIE